MHSLLHLPATIQTDNKKGRGINPLPFIYLHSAKEIADVVRNAAIIAEIHSILEESSAELFTVDPIIMRVTTHAT